jgi:hypothetical protein
MARVLPENLVVSTVRSFQGPGPAALLLMLIRHFLATGLVAAGAEAVSR